MLYQRFCSADLKQELSAAKAKFLTFNNEGK